MKELKDTVDGMLSTDYKERFVAEYQQTKIRYEKLKSFATAWKRRRWQARSSRNMTAR